MISKTNLDLSSYSIYLENVLYVGSVHRESTSFSRYQALKKRSSNIDLINTKAPQSLLFKMKLKFFKGRGLNFDSQLKKILHKNYSMIWVDKPTFFSEEAIKSIKKIKNTKLVAHITDDLKTVAVHYPKIIKILKLFDHVFSPNKYNIKEFPNINFAYNELGYDHNLYQFSDNQFNTRPNSISFVGHYEPEYEKKILKIAKSIAKSDFIISISGSGWWRSYKAVLNKKIKVSYGWIDIEKLKKIYLNSKVCIGLYSTLNRNKTSGRIYEMPILGVPIITEENDIISAELGGNYIDYKIIRDPDKLINILNDTELLEKMRLNAYDSVIKSKCSWDDRIDDALKQIS